MVGTLRFESLGWHSIQLSMPKNYSMMVVLRVGLVLIDGGF